VDAAGGRLDRSLDTLGGRLKLKVALIQAEYQEYNASMMTPDEVLQVKEVSRRRVHEFIVLAHRLFELVPGLTRHFSWDFQLVRDVEGLVQPNAASAVSFGWFGGGYYQGIDLLELSRLCDNWEAAIQLGYTIIYTSKALRWRPVEAKVISSGSGDPIKLLAARDLMTLDKHMELSMLLGVHPTMLARHSVEVGNETRVGISRQPNEVGLAMATLFPCAVDNLLQTRLATYWRQSGMAAIPCLNHVQDNYVGVSARYLVSTPGDAALIDPLSWRRLLHFHSCLEQDVSRGLADPFDWSIVDVVAVLGLLNGMGPAGFWIPSDTDGKVLLFSNPRDQQMLFGLAMGLVVGSDCPFAIDYGLNGDYWHREPYKLCGPLAEYSARQTRLDGLAHVAACGAFRQSTTPLSHFVTSMVGGSYQGEEIEPLMAKWTSGFSYLNSTD